MANLKNGLECLDGTSGCCFDLSISVAKMMSPSWSNLSLSRSSEFFECVKFNITNKDQVVVKYCWDNRVFWSLRTVYKHCSFVATVSLSYGSSLYYVCFMFYLHLKFQWENTIGIKLRGAWPSGSLVALRCHGPCFLNCSTWVFQQLNVSLKYPKFMDFCHPISSVASRQQLRSASWRLLVIPRCRLSTIARRAFSVVGLSVWNSLPDYLRDSAVGRDTFRQHLKTFMFGWY